MYGSVDEFQQVVLLERLENIQLAARQQRAYNLERRILGRCTYQRHYTLFDRTQQRVLLRLRKTMYLVYK